VKEQERDAILRESAPRAQTPRERRDLEGLVEDIRANALLGKPLPLRLRNFQPLVEDYFASLSGPRPYVLRLREIDALEEAHEHELEVRWRELAREESDPAAFARRWRETVEATLFDEVNDLIDRHNRWYPAESRLPMDPRTGDYVLVAGKDYRRRPLDAAWALERFPADVTLASAP
jgi:hypothetical protein